MPDLSTNNRDTPISLDNPLVLVHLRSSDRLLPNSYIVSKVSDQTYSGCRVKTLQCITDQLQGKLALF